MNCSLGPEQMRPFLADLAARCDTFVSAYPNAGLPDPLSPTGFPYLPEDMGRLMSEFAAAGLLNFAGGCCGNIRGENGFAVHGIKGITAVAEFAVHFNLAAFGGAAACLFYIARLAMLAAGQESAAGIMQQVQSMMGGR